MAIRSTILLVEDDSEVGLEMQHFLDRSGHRVLHASNATEAIEIAEREPPLVILTDKDLPTFDLLMELLRNRDGRLKDIIVAIIDINDPQLTDSSVVVLPDFAALDDLIDATHHAPQDT